MADTETTTRMTQLGTVIVPVSDQDRALELYLDKLGFEKRTDVAYGEGERWLEVAPPGEATTIALVPPREGDSAGIDPHAAFTTEDIDGDHEGLRARGSTSMKRSCGWEVPCRRCSSFATRISTAT
jgi:catechol 2,3-dioxygenase-like lactoylglutathione lyase family enzyme